MHQIEKHIIVLSLGWFFTQFSHYSPGVSFGVSIRKKQYRYTLRVTEGIFINTGFRIEKCGRKHDITRKPIMSIDTMS